MIFTLKPLLITADPADFNLFIVQPTHGLLKKHLVANMVDHKSKQCWWDAVKSRFIVAKYSHRLAIRLAHSGRRVLLNSLMEDVCLARTVSVNIITSK
jgi:hypothetical protein